MHSQFETMLSFFNVVCTVAPVVVWMMLDRLMFDILFIVLTLISFLAILHVPGTAPASFTCFSCSHFRLLYGSPFLAHKTSFHSFISRIRQMVATTFLVWAWPHVVGNLAW